MSGACAAVLSVGPAITPNGFEKARGRMGARGAWREKEEAMDR
jgi:hypothetical protein